MCKDCGCNSTGENATQVIKVPGMMCENCKNTVEGALLALPGVMAANVDLDEKNVTVNFNGTKVNTDDMVAAITATGFDVDMNSLGHHHDGIVNKISKFFK